MALLSVSLVGIDMALISVSLALRNHSLYEEGGKGTGSSPLPAQLYCLAGIRQVLAQVQEHLEDALGV